MSTVPRCRHGLSAMPRRHPGGDALHPRSLSLTPGPLPFGSMKSTPAASRAARIFSTLLTRAYCPASKRLTVFTLAVIVDQRTRKTDVSAIGQNAYRAALNMFSADAIARAATASGGCARYAALKISMVVMPA